jgi:hypothetical protein
VIVRTVVLLVFVLSVGSARTLICELTCVSPAQQQSDSCHGGEDETGKTALSATHGCAHDVSPITLTPAKATSIVRVVLSPSEVGVAAAMSPVETADARTTAPPGAPPLLPRRSVSVLRI